MKKRSLSINFEECENLEELASDDQMLIQKAIEIARKSYSPYSKFPVGAAILLENGEIYAGNNQENISFPAGTCAERTVINYVKANFPNQKIKKLAVTALNVSSKNPVTPCGVCRQVIVEMENIQKEPIKVFLHKLDGCTFAFESSSSLLPLAFEEGNLGK